MKKLQFFTFIALSLLLVPSCVKESFKKGMVQKECYGSFILIGEKRYHVCNIESLDGFDNFQEVRVTFKHLHECHGKATTVTLCRPNFTDDGWIEIKSIRTLN